MNGIKKLWIGLGLLALLSPLGLLASNTAWGEWGTEELSQLLGYVPKGLVRFSGIWNAPLPDYSVPQTGEVSGYILSAVIGMALIIIITWGLGRFFVGKRQ